MARAGVKAEAGAVSDNGARRTARRCGQRRPSGDRCRMTEPGPTVAVVFPELLGTYGDGGNVTVLRQRLLWRGVAPEFVTVGLADPVPSGCDLYLLGGGEDDAQAHALAALRRSPGLTVAVEGGATVLAVCAGLQMLGSSITGRDGTVQDGLGLLDADTSHRATRAVGDVVATASPELGLGQLDGGEPRRS